jgi:hypothetical protein
MIDIGSTNPTLIAFGNETYEILKRYFKDEFIVLKIPHFAHFIGKEIYREQVKQIWELGC